MTRRLSEVMRAGAALRPQAFGNAFVLADQGLSSCALGAAYEGAYSTVTLSTLTAMDRLNKDFPVLNQSFLDESGVDKNLILLSTLIFWFNDSLNLSREEIADFVEKCECEVYGQPEKKPNIQPAILQPIL